MLQSAGPIKELTYDYGTENASRFAPLFDVRWLLSILQRRARLVVGVFIATIAAVLLFMLVVPPKYTATAIVLSDPREQRVMSSEAVLPGIGSDAAAVESQVEVLRSTALITQVMDQLGLFRDPDFTGPSLLAEISGLIIGKSRKDPVLERNSAVETFQKMLNVERRGLTYILEVSFTSGDAHKSARIANALVEAYLNDQANLKKSATSGAEDWLKSRLTELEQQLARSERAVADFKAANGIVSLGEGATQRLDRQQLDRIDQELMSAHAAVAEASAKVEQMRNLSSNAGDLEGLASVQGSPIILELRRQYAQAVSLEASFSAALGPEHPTMQRVRSQMLRLRNEIKAEVERVLAAAQIELQAAKAKESSLSASLASATQRLEKNDHLAVQLQELERKAEADKSLYTQLLARSKEVAEQESVQKPDARLIAGAATPTKPIGPGRVILLVLAVVGGGVIAVGSALLAEQFDTSYRTRGEIEADLGIPCLALCPLVAMPSPSGLGSTLAGGLFSAFARAGKAIFSGQRRGLESPYRNEEMFDDSIRLLRHAASSGHRQTGPTTVLVTSALAGEGKTTLAAALAESAASNKRVLLVDADAKAKTLSHLIAPRARHGLFDVLRGDAPLDHALIESSDRIWFLAAGESARDAADLLSSTDLGSLCDYHPFDLIIVDGPPMLSTVEATLLGEAVDYVLLVVEYGRTPRNEVRMACDALAQGGSGSLGAVLNKVEPQAMPYYTYG